MRDEAQRIGPGRRGAEKGGFRETFDADILAEITDLVGPGAVDCLDFEAVEVAARRCALHLAARAIEQRINADRSDHVGATHRCACGQLARYAGRRSKTFDTALGEMTLERAYYCCASCHAGFCPRDRALGLQDTRLSSAITRMVGIASSMVSFAETSELMRELAGVGVDTKRVERAAEALGREIAQDERRTIVSELPKAKTLYLGLDGTGVPMRTSEVAGRHGKQPDGSAKTREAKLVTVWSAEHTDGQGIPQRDPGSASYSAALESAASRDTDEILSEFAQRVEREARRRGFERAQRRVVLGDGALWIWNLADELFPDATQIVDLYHAKGHLWDAAKAIYGSDSDLGQHWGKQRRDELEAGKFDDLLAALRAHAQTNDGARKCVEYIVRNQDRMRYPRFRATGTPA